MAGAPNIVCSIGLPATSKEYGIVEEYLGNY